MSNTVIIFLKEPVDESLKLLEKKKVTIRCVISCNRGMVTAYRNDNSIEDVRSWSFVERAIEDVIVEVNDI